MDKIRDRYVALFENAIDSALSGTPQKIAFCSDVVLELYLGEDKMLHWRKIDGECAGNKERDGYS